MFRRLLVGIALIVLISGAGIAARSFVNLSNEEMPIRAVKIVIPKGTQNEYVDQIRRFADLDAFAIRVSHSSPDAEDILVQLWRSDVNMDSVNASDTGAQDITFEIGIYKSANIQIPSASIDQLVADLQKTVGHIKGARFSNLQVKGN
jgi:hypothetical protein